MLPIFNHILLSNLAAILTPPILKLPHIDQTNKEQKALPPYCLLDGSK